MLLKSFLIGIISAHLISGVPVCYAETSLTTSPSLGSGNSSLNPSQAPSALSESSGPSMGRSNDLLSDRASNLAKELSARRALRNGGSSEAEGISLMGRGAEFSSGHFPGAVLIPVQLWGGVRQSGLHHIPVQTSLYKLITLAGGPTADADMTSLTISRNNHNKKEVIRLNLEELISNPNQEVPALEPNDIVIVGTKEPWISNNTTAVVGLVAGVLGIIVSGFIISNQLKH